MSGSGTYTRSLAEEPTAICQMQLACPQTPRQWVGQTTQRLSALVASMPVTLALESPESLFLGQNNMGENSTQTIRRMPQASDTQTPRMPGHPRLPVIPTTPTLTPPVQLSSSPLSQSLGSLKALSPGTIAHATKLPYLSLLEYLHPLLPVETWLPEVTADPLRW